MAATARKDYGSNAIVADSNPTLKRVNTQNAPFSVQATGHDLPNSKLIPLNSENLDALEQGTRVLDAQIEKYVKSVSKTGTEPNEVLTSAVIGYINGYTGEETTKTYTKQELLNSSTIFLAKV